MAIEADHYREEEARLKQHPDIIEMAESLKAHGMVETFLNDPDAMNRCYHRANELGIEFSSIGGPHRAIRALLTAEAESDAEYIRHKENIAREARACRVPMTHEPKDEEYMPVLAYRVDQEIAKAERRIRELKALRDRFTA